MPLKNPPFGNAVLKSLYQTAVLCISKRSLMDIGQSSSCGPQILVYPAEGGRVRGNAAISCCRGNSRRHVDGKRGIFRYFGKSIFSSLLIENSLIEPSFNFFCTKCCNSCENKKFETMCSALAQIILLICRVCLFIQYSYFLLDNLVSSYGQQFIFQLSLSLPGRITSG